MNATGILIDTSTTAVRKLRATGVNPSMRNALLVFVFANACLLVCSKPEFAHHGGSAYDAAHPLTVTGTVKDFQFIQPHPLITLEVKDDQGNVKHWILEADAASAINAQGWTKTAVNPGDVVTVYLYQARNGNPVGRAGKLVLADGRSFGSGNLFDQPKQCDKDFGPGGSASAACRPDGRKTQSSDVPVNK